MNLRIQLLAIGTVFALLFGGATQAQAAKGVKKKPVTEHHHHGKVVAVDHKSGSITILEHHKGKKKVVNGKAVNHTHKFSVNSTSKFFVAQKKQRKATNFAAVHKGEHVSVAAHNHHADTVVIHSKAAKTGKKVTRRLPGNNVARRINK